MLGKVLILILILSNIGCDQLEKMIGGKKAKTAVSHIEPGPVVGTYTGDQSFVTYTWAPPIGGGTSYPELNGWFPSASTDGNYVGAGQTNVAIFDLPNRRVIPIQNGNCYRIRFLRPGVATYINIFANDQAYRMEALASTNWATYQTGDDPHLVAGNQFNAGGGHWASWLGGRGIAYDGIDLGYGYGMSQNETWVGFAPNNNNDQLLMFNNAQFVGSFYPQTAMGEWDVLDGHAAYGGHGPVWGYSPAGDIDLTIESDRYEGNPKLMRVGDSIWVATTSWSFSKNKGYILVRPYGDRAAIVFEIAAATADVAFTGSEFVAVGSDDQGKIVIKKAPVNAPRYTF